MLEFVNEPFDFRLGNWYVSMYLHPRVWGLDFHRNRQCCKFWLLVGPFEINRMWADTDHYPYDDEGLKL